MFQFIYDMSGFNHALTLDLPIEKTTKIERGQLVKLSLGKIIRPESGSYMGVANETHTGEYDPFNPRNDKELINVIVSPQAVYSTDYITLTFDTASSSSTTAIFPGPAAFKDTDVVGTHIILRSKGATSANTDNIGDVRQITGYDKPTKTMTISEGGIIGVGDVYSYMPPIGFRKLIMDPTCSFLMLDEYTGDFVITGEDFENKKMYVSIRNSQLS